MHYYLTTFTGDGTHASPFRASGMNGPGGIIDLRPDPTKRPGFCLLGMPTHNPAIARYFGEDLSAISASVKTAINSALSITLTKNRLDDIFFELLDPNGGLASEIDSSKWRPITATRENQLEIYLLGQLIARKSSAPQNRPDLIDPTDNFNRANETPLAAPWARLTGSTGNINLASNGITASAAGDKFYYYTSAASSGNQYSEFTQVSAVTGNDWGPAIRVGSSGFSGYWFSQFDTAAVVKYVSGTFSNIEVLSLSAVTNGTIVRIEGNGSTLTSKRNGGEVTGSPSTDTSLTSGQPGIFIYDTGGSLDDFNGGDLADTLMGQALL